MTSSHHAPYALGYTRTTMVGTTGSELARVSESHQTRPQFRLQAGKTPALYAKVLDLAPGESHGFYVHFSAMPTDIAQRFYQLYQGALAQPAAIASAQGG